MATLTMATMTIRNIDDQLITCLRIQAALHGCSMENEAGNILRAALSAEPIQGLDALPTQQRHHYRRNGHSPYSCRMSRIITR